MLLLNDAIIGHERMFLLWILTSIYIRDQAKVLKMTTSGSFRLRRTDTFQKALRSIKRRFTRRSLTSAIIGFIPIIEWLPQYNWQRSFFGDLSGGLTMAVFAVPQGIAHAAITGVDPVYGLYTAIFPSFLYIFFGTSKHNSLGGFAVLSLMTHAAIEKVMMIQAVNYNCMNCVNQTFIEYTNYADLSTNPSINVTQNVSNLIEEVIAQKWTNGYRPIKRIHIATTIVFLSGVMQILMGIFRLECLTCYFSEQVMSGFVVGGCVHVFFAQIGDILGIRLQRRAGPGYLYYRVQDLFAQLHETKASTVAMSVSSMAFLVFGKEILAPWLSKVFLFPVPYELILAVVAITATNFAELSERHSISVVGNIPTSFPPPSLPRFDLIPAITIDALSIAAVAVAVHATVAKIVEKRYEYGIKCGQELYALGFVGVLSSLFPVFPVTSGFARSVIGVAVGGSTQLTSLFSSLALLSVILYIGPALEYLPKCVLASMVMVTMKAYVKKFTELRKLWPMFKIDFLIWTASMLLTICYDMAEGLALAVAFAILTTIFRNQWPRWHILSKNDEGQYRETKKKQIEYIEGSTCIFRMDGPLIFTSVDRFALATRECVKKWRQKRLQRNFVTIEEMNRESEQRIESELFSRKAIALHPVHFNAMTATTEPAVSLVIDCSGFPYVDYLGLTTIKKVYTELTSEGVDVYFAGAREELMKMFQQTDFYHLIDSGRVFMRVSEAVDACERKRSQLATHSNSETSTFEEELVATHAQDLNSNSAR